jgi:hypothetical protein
MATAAEVPVAATAAPAEQKFSRLTLVGMVVGSMVGAGIFSLPGGLLGRERRIAGKRSDCGIQEEACPRTRARAGSLAPATSR